MLFRFLIILILSIRTTYTFIITKRQYIKRIINISSGSAYGNGGFGDTGWKDDLDEFGTREDPRTLYAISKYAGHRCNRFFFVFSSSNKNWKYKVIYR